MKGENYPLKRRWYHFVKLLITLVTMLSKVEKKLFKKNNSCTVKKRVSNNYFYETVVYNNELVIGIMENACIVEILTIEQRC